MSSPDGRVLVAHDTIRIGIMAGGQGQAKERELAWLDWSSLFDISPDGKTILFSETGEGTGPEYSTFIRGTDGSAPIRLGDGRRPGSVARRPVGAVLVGRATRSLTLYPTGAGDGASSRPGISSSRGGTSFTPDGKRILTTANEPGHGSRIFVMDLAGSKPRPLSPEGYRSYTRGVSPDGTRIAVTGPDRKRISTPWRGRADRDRRHRAGRGRRRMDRGREGALRLSAPGHSGKALSARSGDRQEDARP